MLRLFRVFRALVILFRGLFRFEHDLIRKPVHARRPLLPTRRSVPAVIDSARKKKARLAPGFCKVGRLERG
jgi:hypothetical protein